MFNTGFFVTDAIYCYGRENDDTERDHVKSKRTSAGQGTWQRSLPARFIDMEQMSVEELMPDFETMPHTIRGDYHHSL